ncbi:MAG: histidinol dehydrogenase [Gammaproteobacteria bacterium]
MPDINRLRTTQADFQSRFNALLTAGPASEREVWDTVRAIVDDVRARGDAALLEYTRRFDHYEVAHAAELEIPPSHLRNALDALPSAQRAALETAAERLMAYAEHQKLQPWEYTEPDGTRLGQQVTPLDRVGLYVPGGKAAYPSTLLMNAIPARVAGVGELVMTAPAPRGAVNDMVLAVAGFMQIDRVLTIGGAQAVAALAYGTETVPAVDKIVGPGNTYVATAKRLVFGAVGIDMIAGPTEIMVVCDGQADPDWIAMDLFSQAEHEEYAGAVLLCPDRDYLERVAAAMDRLLPSMPRADVIRAALRNRGALIEVRDLDEAVEWVNFAAPEHLQLAVAEPASLARQVRHAGAIFLGHHSPETLGDYCAGPNHVLPTGRTARFSSPLGVYDFQKRSSVIHCSPRGAAALAPTAAILAREEGLIAHAQSAEYRSRK